MNKNILKHIIRYLLMICIVIVCITIFKFSSANGGKSSKTSTSITKWIVSIIWKDNPEYNTEALVNAIHPVIRKIAHFQFTYYLEH